MLIFIIILQQQQQKNYLLVNGPINGLAINCTIGFDANIRPT